MGGCGQEADPSDAKNDENKRRRQQARTMQLVSFSIQRLEDVTDQREVPAMPSADTLGLLLTMFGLPAEPAPAPAPSHDAPARAAAPGPASDDTPAPGDAAEPGAPDVERPDPSI